MPLPTDLALTNYNYRTHRYNFARVGTAQDVSFDTTQAYAVNTAVICKKKQYWADHTIGSDLTTLRNLTSATPSQAVSMVLDALLPLEQLNQINANPTATAQRGSLNAGVGNQLQADLKWTTPGGQGGSASFGV